MASSTTEVTATVDTLGERRLDLLARVEQRVLWLAVRIVDYANRERPNEDELKVGGFTSPISRPPTVSRSSRTLRRCSMRSSISSADSIARI